MKTQFVISALALCLAIGSGAVEVNTPPESPAAAANPAFPVRLNATLSKTHALTVIHKGPNDHEAANVLEVERQRVDALIRDDHAALEQILANDLTCIHASGTIETKAEFLESLTSGRLKYKTPGSSTTHVRVYGDTAILTGNTQVHSVSIGVDDRSKLRFTLVYVKRDSLWQLAAWHSTRLPD